MPGTEAAAGDKDSWKKPVTLAKAESVADNSVALCPSGILQGRLHPVYLCVSALGMAPFQRRDEMSPQDSFLSCNFLALNALTPKDPQLHVIQSSHGSCQLVSGQASSRPFVLSPPLYSSLHPLPLVCDLLACGFPN